MTDVLIRPGKFETEIDREEGHVKRGRIWIDAVVSQGMPKIEG